MTKMVWPKDIIAFVSPPGIVMYPHVFKKNPEEDDAGKYWFSVMLKFDKAEVGKGGEYEEEFRDMRKQFARAAKEGWPGGLPDELASPVRDGDKFDKANNKKRKDELLGHFYINFKCGGSTDENGTEGQPTVVEAPSLRQITSREDFYPGCKAVVSGTAFPYENKGNEGVGVRLTNICKMGDGERVGGKPSAKDQFAKFGKGAPSQNDSDADDLL